MTKRLFIGINFSDETKDYFHQIQMMVEKYCERGHYSAKDNFHLTLKFMGSKEEEDISKMIEIIDSLDAYKMTIRFDHIGFFAKKNKYVIYAGCLPNYELTKLANEIDDELFELKLSDKQEPVYTPHLTLIRSAKLLVPSVDVSRGIEVDKEVKITNITLYESINIDGVLKYIPIYVRELVEKES